MLIDNFSDQGLISNLGTKWRSVSDKVMGGISQSFVSQTSFSGKSCLLLTGKVSLENNGGFIQATLDLSRTGHTFDASSYFGISLVVRGNNEQYSVHLRTIDSIHPWQSYRAHFFAGPDWETIDLPFTVFSPHRLDAHLDVSRLRRIGIVAIGRCFSVDLALSEVRFLSKG